MENFKKIKNAYIEDALKIASYGNKNIYNDESDYLVDLVHDKMTEIAMDNDFAFHILKKIMPRERVLKEILTYDLLNYCPDKQVESFEEFVNVCIKTLKKFQWKVGGFNLEDKDWILKGKDNKRFKIKDNQKILYNSTEKKYCDKELIWFLENILLYVQKFADDTQFHIKYTWVEDERFSICWIIIILTNYTENDNKKKLE